MTIKIKHSTKRNKSISVPITAIATNKQAPMMRAFIMPDNLKFNNKTIGYVVLADKRATKILV